jgi:hypothetical protein
LQEQQHQAAPRQLAYSVPAVQQAPAPQHLAAAATCLALAVHSAHLHSPLVVQRLALLLVLASLLLASLKVPALVALQAVAAQQSPQVSHQAVAAAVCLQV